MRFAEIQAAMPPVDPNNLEASAVWLDRLMQADDINPEQRQAFCSGYVTGVSFALAAVKDGDVDTAATKLLERLQDWERKGWIS